MPTPVSSQCGTPKFNGNINASPMVASNTKVSDDIIRRTAADDILVVEKTNDIVSHINLDDRTDSGSVKSSGFDRNSLSRVSDLDLADSDAKNFKSNSDSLSHFQDGFHNKRTNDVVSSNNSSLDDSGKTGSELEDSLSNLEVNGYPEPLSLILDDPNSITDIQQNLDDDFYDYDQFKDPLENDSPAKNKINIGTPPEVQKICLEPPLQNAGFSESNVTSTNDMCNGLSSSEENQVKIDFEKLDSKNIIDPITPESSNYSIDEKGSKSDEHEVFDNYQFGTLLRESIINEINFDDINSECKSTNNFANFSLSFDDDDLNPEKSLHDSKFTSNSSDVNRDNDCFETPKSDFILGNEFQQSNEDLSNSKTADFIQNNYTSSINANELESHDLENNVKYSDTSSGDKNCDLSNLQNQQNYFEDSEFQSSYDDKDFNNENNLESNEVCEESRFSTNNYVSDFEKSLPDSKDLSDDEFYEIKQFASDVCESLDKSTLHDFSSSFIDNQNFNEDKQVDSFQTVPDEDDDFGDFADFSNSQAANVPSNDEHLDIHVEDDFGDFESSAPVVETPKISLKESICQIENKNVSK